MQPLYTNCSGDLLVDKNHTAAAALGYEFIKAEDYIPMPDGATFTAMPGRVPLVFDALGKLCEGKGTAVAVLLPQGFTRTLLPSCKRVAGPDVLPLLGYTACAQKNGKVYVAARQTDEHRMWHPDLYNTPDLPQRINKVKKRFPDNRIVSQLARCSLDYGCFTAQNLFYHRFEAGLPVSKSCNARCVGCISLQESQVCASAQGRIGFSPDVKEIVEVAAYHLSQRNGEGIISFGQGCEGDPTTEARKVSKAINIVRSKIDTGTINMNTNGGNTQHMKVITDAGIDSFRVSLFSAIPDHNNAYYRPKNYTSDDVEASVVYAVDHDVFVSLNLLAMPGFTDREEEIKALCDFIKRTGLHQVQIRNLNIDADYFYKVCGFVQEKSMGMDKLIDALKETGVEVGNYSKNRRKK